MGTALAGVAGLLPFMGGPLPLGLTPAGAVADTWVAVGYGGKIMSSSDDGASWTERTSPWGSVIYRDVHWSNGQYVAVAEKGYIATSANGTTWQQRDSGLVTGFSSSSIYSVYADDASGQWVAGTAGVGGGRVLKSPNGATWTTQFISGWDGGGSILGVHHANDQWVVVGSSGLSCSSALTVAVSPDGTNWTVHEPFQFGMARDVTYSPQLGLWAMVGEHSATCGGAAGKHIYTSSDGVTWTTAFTAEVDMLGSVDWGGDKFVAGASGSFYVSADGASWSPVPVPNADWAGDAYRGSKNWVAVGSDDQSSAGRAWTSPDATTWTERTVPTTQAVSAVTSNGRPPIVPIGGPVLSSELRGHSNPSENCTPCVIREEADPVNPGTGNFSETFTDLTVPGRSRPLAFSRTYNSETSTVGGPLGYGWTHSYNVSLTIAPDESTVTVTQEGASEVTFTKSGTVYTAPPRVTATLVKNGDGTFTLTRRARELLDFDSAGQLTTLRDLNGYATTLAYSAGKLSTVTDPAGRTLTFTYSGPRITSVSDSSSPARTVSFSYDGSGNLEDVTDVGNGNWHFTYDASHRMLTKRDPRGNTVTNHYEAGGRVDWQDDQLGRRTTFDYGSIPGATKVTDPKGNVHVYRYVSGLLTSETAGYGTSAEATWSYEYDLATLGVKKVTDPNGRVTRATYDARGNRLTHVDPLNRTTTWTYNTLNQPLTVTDPLGVTTTMTYDAAGNLLTRSRPLKDAGGNTIATQTTTYGYGGTTPVFAGDVTSVTDPIGNVTQLRYDAFGNLTQTIAPPTPENSAGNTTTFAYDTAKGWLTSQVSPRGNLTGANPNEHRTVYERDAFGRMTKIKDPLWSAATPSQHQRAFAYDANGNLTSETDGNNQTTTFTYNAANELTTTTRADGTTLATSYDKVGNVVSRGDGAGFKTTYAYDALDRLTATATYQGVARSDDPVAWWRLGEASGTTMADSSGNARNGTYNTAGVTYGAAGAVPADADTAVTFNGSSGYASVADNDAFSPQVGTNGAITVGAWIKLSALPPTGGENRTAIVSKSANAGYEYGLYAYSNGNVGFQLWRSNGNSHAVAVGGSIPLNQWVHVVGTYKNGVATKVYLNGAEVGSSTTFSNTTSNGSGTVNVGRRHNGQYLAGSVDEVAIYNHALSADRVTKHYHGGRGTTYAYDAAGNRTSMTDPAGQTTTYSYDVADQLTAINYSDPATPDVTSITYDADGQRTAMTDGTGTSTWAWDSLNRLTSSTDGAGNTVGYGYDIEGQQTSITYPGSNTVTRHFDAAGRLDWVEDWNADRTTFAYDADSNPTTTVFPLANGIGSTSTFDNGDRLTRIDVTKGVLPVASFAYGRDGHDQLSSVTSTGVPLDNHAYTYTQLEQLKNVDAGAYGYDAADNLTQLASGGRQGFDRLNEVCWSTTGVPMGTPTCRTPPTGATTYGYDSRGNRTSVTPSGGSATTLAYDQANRLTAYGANATYAYNGNGLRTSKAVSGTTTSFVYDVSGPLPLVLQETTGATTKRYVYGPGERVIATITGSTTTYHHHDQLGSTRVLTDSTGTVVGTFTYDAYGKQTGSTGAATTPFGFTGQYTDAETGFQYLRARYYDPATANFLTRDPMEPITGTPYAYVGGNPLNAVDPSGMCGEPANFMGPTKPCVYDEEYKVKRIKKGVLPPWEDVGDPYRFRERTYHTLAGIRQVNQVSWFQKQEMWWREGDCLFSAQRKVKRVHSQENYLWDARGIPGLTDLLPSDFEGTEDRQQGNITVRKLNVGPGPVMVGDDFSLFR